MVAWDWTGVRFSDFKNFEPRPGFKNFGTGAEPESENVQQHDHKTPKVQVPYNLNNAGCESLFIEIPTSSGKPFITGVINRHPTYAFQPLGWIC